MKKNEVFTVENAKVADVTYRMYKPFRNGYIKDEEGIVFVSVISVLVDLKNQKFISTLQDAEGKQYVREGEYALYKDRKCYEDGIRIAVDEFETRYLIRKIDWKHLCNCEWIRTDDATDDSPAYGYSQVWRFENGGPIATPLVVKSVILESAAESKLNDGSIPEEFWESREDAFSFNEYKVVDEEGVEYIEKGASLRIKPTKEQFEILNELKAVFKKAMDAGLLFVWDRDNCSNVKAYNGAEVREMIYCDDAESYQGGDVVNIADVTLADTGICFYDYCGCDHYDIVMQPTERQKRQWLKEHPEHSEE